MLRRSPRVDAHHHFWRYNPAEYGWIDHSMSVLRRDFLPEHLCPELQGAGFHGAISVQARQSLEETEWLLDLAESHPLLLAVVGWVPLLSPELEPALERLAARPKLRGVRHVVQSEPDDRFLLRDDFNAGISKLEPYGLVYDILIYERQLPAAIEFVDRHPRQRFVLDHIAKPRIRDGALSPWRDRLFEIARRPNVYCKLSGIVTEADFHLWTEAQIRPFLDATLDAFGPQRILFGSDWPVCLAAASHHDWLATVERAIAALSDSEQARILGGTALEAYSLEVNSE
jgi:L-fuconolactonase